MDCNLLLIGKIQEIDNLGDSIKIKIKFNKFENSYIIPTKWCDFKQVSKIQLGTKVSCLFNGNNLIKVFLEPSIYTNQPKNQK